MSRIPQRQPISADVETIARASEPRAIGEDEHGTGAPPRTDEREALGGFGEDRDELDVLAAASVEGRRPGDEAEARQAVRLP